MKKKTAILIRTVFLILATLTTTHAIHAQPKDPLDQIISVECHQQRLDQVLANISHKGNFYFSYESHLLKPDSLVDLNATNKPVRQILDQLFNSSLEYKEDGNYIILRKKNPPPVPVNEDKHYTITGFIVDENTGEKISKASIYDREGLVATLSNDDGFFTVRLKKRPGPASLSISKEYYEDKILRLQPGVSQQLTIDISPALSRKKMVTIGPDNQPSDSIRIDLEGDSGTIRSLHLPEGPIRVEMTTWGRIILSSRFKFQSLNICQFFTERAFQVSFLPGLGTDGLLSSQVTNRFSINILGGYTGGLQGVELGGLFNVDKKQVHGVQAAGIINLVGGPVKGAQLAGLHNTVLDSTHGIQAAGISNFNKGNFHGVQLAGIYNCIADTLSGSQAAGIMSCARVVRGFQLSGLINQTHRLQGMQLGVINIADSSDGVSLGLINVIKNGLHEISFFSNEVSPYNIAFRSGSNKLYSILLAGFTPDDQHKSYHYGLGIGRRIPLSHTLSLSPELSSEHLAAGSWDNFKQANFIEKFSLDLHWRPTRHFAISGGPSFAAFWTDKLPRVQGHDFSPLSSGYNSFSFSDKVLGWVGWRASVSLL